MGGMPSSVNSRHFRRFDNCFPWSRKAARFANVQQKPLAHSDIERRHPHVRGYDARQTFHMSVPMAKYGKFGDNASPICSDFLPSRSKRLHCTTLRCQDLDRQSRCARRARMRDSPLIRFRLHSPRFLAQCAVCLASIEWCLPRPPGDSEAASDVIESP